MNIQSNGRFDKKNQSFGLGLDSVLNGLTTGLQYCDKFPMIGVSVVDGTTAIGPRTIVGFQTNIHSGFEWFRKESSGLIVNCLIPSFIVLGLAKLIQKPILKKFANFDLASSWANQESLEKLSGHYQKNINDKNPLRSYVSSVLSDVKGLDGSDWINYKDKNLNSVVDTLVDAIENKTDKKSVKKAVSKAYSELIEQTKAGEILKFGDEKISSLNLSSLLRDMVDLGKKFKDGAVSSDLSGFQKVLLKLINTKRLVGLFGIIIPLAASMQYINREITKKLSGVEGAPIYKDFGKEEHKIKLNEKEKRDLFLGKIKSSALMLGTAWLSMLKIPSVQNLQFNGIFPTLDQCRFISTATILGRIWKAEDPRDLSETTKIDIGTFAGLYFLGDYMSKAVASLFEKIMPDVKLLNRLEVSDKNTPIHKRIINWVKNTKIKSFDEIKASDLRSLSTVKNLRSICQLSNLGFSMALLGLVLPMYARKRTAKWEQQKEQEKLQKDFENSSLQLKSPSNILFKDFNP